MNELEAAFHQYFEIICADTPELLKISFDLRYRVLCVHNTFPDFSGSQFPDKLERDEYDDRSIHFLLRHKPSNTFIGTTRLILPDPHQSENKLPTELNTQFYPEFQINSPMRKHIAEISRFTILNDFFKRKGEHNMLSQSTEIESKTRERRRFPHPMLALVIGIIQLCASHNIYHLISSMEPALNRLLSFYGLQMHPIGPSTDYHGTRAPYYIYLPDLLDKMYHDYRPLWELVTDHGNIWPADLTSLRTKNKSQPAPDNICIPG